MKLGISSWAYPWAVGVPGHEPEKPLNAFGLLELAAELGVEVAQFADNLPLHMLSDVDLSELDYRARQLGLDIEVGTVGLTDAHLKEYLRIATILDSTLVRVVIDTDAWQPSAPEVVEVLRALAPDFSGAGVQLLIENHDRFPSATLASILEDVSSDAVGVCLDTVNSLGNLETVESVMASVRPWIGNVHVKDFTIGRIGNRMGFLVEGAPVGSGRLDVPWLVRETAALQLGANLILEQWPPFVGNLAATIENEHSWAERSVRYLQQTLETL